MKTVIMAGGRGTRIAEVFPNIPKPLIPIDGKPVLEREIIDLKNQGFSDIIITLSHMANQIEDYFGDGSKLGVKIEYYIEETPLGNAGALFELKDKLVEDFLLLNADAIFDVDFNRFVNFHIEHGGLATLFTHPNDHPYDSGLIIADADNKVINWLTKENHRPLYYKNRVNAGLHVLSPELIQDRPKTPKVDLDRQILKPLSGTGKMFCYDSPEYVKDMGTPERFEMVSEDYKAGKVRDRNLRNKQKAIFLDRDGTINKYVGFLKDINEFELLPNVVEAIKLINKSGYLAIVTTNQPVIARGEVTYEQLDEIHNKMETLLGNEGAFVDAIYFCPHHPHKGFSGEIPELKMECNCRKPNPGMLFQAAEDFNIDLSKSWIVGDSQNDVLAGKNAGVKTGFITTDGFDTKITPTITGKSLLDIVKKILIM